jgi:hypothetical protein
MATGERLVLAELVVDSTGVVRGVKSATDSFRFLPENLEKHGRAAASTGDRYLGALEHRFLGFRHVAGALLGGFTVAGIVVELESLASSLVSNTEAWQTWSRGIQDAMHAIGGESEAGKTLRNLTESLKGTGAKNVLGEGETAEAIKKAMADVQTTLKTMKGPSTKAPEFAFGVMQLPEPGPLTQEQLILQKELQDQLEILKRKLLDVQRESGMTAFAFDKLWGTDTQHMVVEATRLVDGFTDSLRKAKEVAAKGQRLPGNIFNESPAQPLGAMQGAPPGVPIDVGEQFHNVEVSADGVVTHIKAVTDEFHQLSDAIIGNQGALQQWGETTAVVIGEKDFTPLDKLTEKMAKANVQVDKATERYAKFQIVASASYEAVDAAAQAGVISQQLATRVRLGLMATEALLKAEIETGLAAASAAGGDYESAALHGIAAGLLFAAAAFDVVGAVKGAGGGGGGGGYGGGVVAAAGAGGGGGGPQYHYELRFYGPTIGFNKDQLGRWLKDLERRQAGSNP